MEINKNQNSLLEFVKLTKLKLAPWQAQIIQELSEMPDGARMVDISHDLQKRAQKQEIQKFKNMFEDYKKKTAP